MNKRISFFCACLLGYVAAFAQTFELSSEIKSIPNSLQFFVLGDWGRKGNSPANSPEVRNQIALAVAMDEVGKIIKPEFIVSTGDNFYPAGVKNDLDPRWKETFEEVYHGMTLQTPWYVVLGNHDHGGNVKGEIDYDKNNEHRRWYLPANYYSKILTLPDASRVKFIFIDTTPLIRGKDTTQLDWLAKELAETTVDWKWVVGHHPLYSGNHRVGEQRKLREDIEDLLIRNNVDVYLCGHDHNLQYLKKDKMKCFISGAGSEIYQSKELTSLTQYVYCKEGVECTSAFMVFSLEKESVTVQMIDSRGQLLYKTNIKK